MDGGAPGMKSRKLDVLFIHVGRRSADHCDTLIMPVGLVMLADHLERHGLAAGVLNLSVELLENPRFNVERFIERCGPGVLAFPLHWHSQLKDALACLARLKRRFPQKTTVAGGFSASLFFRDILALPGAPDFIIRGDAEKPLLALCRSLLRGVPGLARVPNLAWRRQDGTVEATPQSYVATGRDLSGLSYSNLDLILNKENVMKYSDEQEAPLRRRPGERPPDCGKVFYVAGRGCANECSFCGGASGTQALANGRRGAIYKPAGTVVKDLRLLLAAGVRKVHFAFDPLPRAGYYPDLFSRLRRAGLRFKATFEAFGLPTERFLRAYAEALPGSRVIVSPESGSERVRRLNRCDFYKNPDLLSRLALMKSLGLEHTVCFSVGLPFETRRDFLATLRLAGKVKKLCPKGEVFMSPIQLEPFSPLYRTPQKYGASLDWTSLKDFLEQKPRTLGYSAGLMGEREVWEKAALFNRAMR